MNLALLFCESSKNLLLFILELILVYCIYQFSHQVQAVYLISYKFIILFYLAFIFIYTDNDFAALLIWMIYGGFLSIFFILSLAWLDLSFYRFQSKIYWYNYIIIGLAFYYSVHFSQMAILWDLIFINYYELLILDYDEELEILGLGIGLENWLLIIIISLMLTVICLLIVIIIISGRKFISLCHWKLYILSCHYITQVKFITLRSQIFYKQEELYLSPTNKHFKLFHCRRL